jgi:hypothetical protein
MGCGPAQIRGADPDTGEQTRSRSSMFEMLKECSSEGMIKLNLPQRPDTPDVACYYSKLGLIAITCLGNDFEVSHLGEKTTAGDYYFDAVGPVRFAGPKQKHWVAINGPLAPKYSAGLPLVESVVVTDFSLPMCDPKATGYARKIADKCGGVTGKGQCIGKTVQFCNYWSLEEIICPNSCGWSPNEQIYFCGHTGSAPDSGAGSSPSDPSLPPSPGTTPSQGGCGGITETGCCDGDTLKYCSTDGTLKAQLCGTCGWYQGKGWYDCGYTGSAPSNTPPRSCSAL